MGGSSSPKPPKPTAEEKAMEYRTNLGLKKERARTETMLKNQARGKLGVQSLLGGIEPDTSLKQKDVAHSEVTRPNNLFFGALDFFKRNRIEKMGILAKRAEERSERKRKGTYKPTGQSKNRIDKISEQYENILERKGK